jgi:symplekin
LDKHELQRRAKRAKAQSESVAAKKIKLEKENSSKSVVSDKVLPREMEIDLDELAEQKSKSNKLNETFIMDNLKTVENVVQMVILCMKHLPDEVPSQFLQNYAPVINLSLPQQMQKIAQILAQQMTDKQVGPGSTAISKEPPMKLKISVAEERNIIMSAKNKMAVDDGNFIFCVFFKCLNLIKFF